MGRRQRHDRAETVEKAMNLFWRNGFSGTSMRDLEDCLDMRPGSIYASFGNKEALYRETIDYYAARSFSNFQSHMENAETFMAGLKLFIRQLLFNHEDPCSCMLAKTFSDINPDNATLREKAGQMMSSFENILIVELKQARAAGEIAKNCDIGALARYIQMQIIGLRSYAEMQKPRTVIEQLLDDALQAIKDKAGCAVLT